MKLYIFPWVDSLTGNYHEGGGAVVITDNDPIQILAESRANSTYPPEGDELGIEFELVEVYEVGEAVETVHIFPDAGCC